MINPYSETKKGGRTSRKSPYWKNDTSQPVSNRSNRYHFDEEPHHDHSEMRNAVTFHHFQPFNWALLWISGWRNSKNNHKYVSICKHVFFSKISRKNTSQIWATPTGQFRGALFQLLAEFGLFWVVFPWKSAKAAISKNGWMMRMHPYQVNQSALFGMVKWPFGKVKWPPTRG